VSEPAAFAHCARARAGVILLALLGAGCQQVAESSHIAIETPALAYGPPCASTLGSYALPKAFIHIQIGQVDKNTPPDIAVPAAGAPPVNVVRHPDRSLLFCLDYLASAFSDDNIKVLKSQPPGSSTGPKEAFLGAVSFNVTDQTAYILEALIRAGFILASGNPQFLPRNAPFADNQIIADLEFDPFDQRESAQVNARLQKLGFCLVLASASDPSRPEIFTFDPYTTTLDRYCNDPLRFDAHPTMVTKAYLKAEATPADPQLPGLLYRPQFPYHLLIYQRPDKDPVPHDSWQLTQVTTVNLENFSPVLSLGVTRAVFAGKSVSFVFQEGTLKTACVAKTSELEGFVQVPLQIAKSIVALPASLVAVQIGNVQSQTQLVQAEQQLYLIQRAYLLNLMGQNTPTVTNPPTKPTTPSTPLPDPANFKIPADLAPQLPISTYGSDLLQNKLDQICAGTS
jgi:hypothetical protein